MSSSLLEKPQTPSMERAPLPDATALENKFPVEWMLSSRAALLTTMVGIVYFFFCLKPLHHTDLWGHLAYGQWIVSEGIPTTEPLMPLAKGMPWIDTAWLSQVILYGTSYQFGVAGLQGLYALTVACCAACVVALAYRQTQSTLASVVSLALFLWIDWFQLGVARPQLAALAIFLLITVRTIDRAPSRFDWWGVPLLMAAWGNLHGSFLLGLVWLVVIAVGRAIDLVSRTGTLRSLSHDRRALSWLLIAQLSAVAVLANPYGWGLYAEVFRVTGNANLTALTEWQALTIRSLPGQIFMMIAVCLMLVYPLTPRRVRAWEPLVLIGLGLASLWSLRFMVWWAPVASLLLVVHATAVLRRGKIAWPTVTTISGKWTVVTIGVIWIFFAYSPFGMRLIHHREPNLEKVLGPDTPLTAAAWLREHPPTGQIFNSYEWGDYLLWAGPPNLQVFVDSHAHLVPREVWQHYLQIVEQGTGWTDTLDKYSVNTIVLDTHFRGDLIKQLKKETQWKLRFEDKTAAIFTRVESAASLKDESGSHT